MRVQILEAVDVDLTTEHWACNRCGHDLGPASRPYKEGCVIRERNPNDVHLPRGGDPEFNFSPDPKWIRIIEFYCPACAVMVENEYLPLGHPLTWDIDLNLDQLKRKHGLLAAQSGAAER